ncbi:MAG: putative R-SNARE protein, Sec22-family [Streblomastix strix]|uniref:Putative R-SNARE protein, Sec22-family n=1 Tax=Streblomastix strix TaxID=222440 RepID=A0A5J4WU74_9EUKA|nr:MAG: putative R-SNARE protein, Sec22-family [Streblomastix strix]
MPILTSLIGRLGDGLILAGSMMDDHSIDIEPLKKKAKQLIKKLTESSPKQMAVQDGRYFFYYSIVQNVVFVALCNKAFRQDLAFSFLEDVSRDFLRLYAQSISNASRPYEFVAYDMELEKRRMRYSEESQQAKLEELGTEMNNVRGILTRNLDEVIGRGEKIDVVRNLSQSLVHDSQEFRRNATELNRGGLRAAVPYAVVGIVVLLAIFIRSKFLN